MMSFMPGQQVKIRVLGEVVEREATIRTRWDGSLSHSDDYWSVNFINQNGVSDVTLVSEQDLIKWNSVVRYKTTCTCGAKSVGVPDKEIGRHSHHCDLVSGGKRGLGNSDGNL